MRFSYAGQPFCCGLGVVGGFDGGYGATEVKNVAKSGCDIVTASFHNSESNRKAYNAMCKEYKLLYQSPVRPNRRHEGQTHVFICVFDQRK